MCSVIGSVSAAQGPDPSPHCASIASAIQVGMGPLDHCQNADAAGLATPLLLRKTHVA